MLLILYLMKNIATSKKQTDLELVFKALSNASRRHILMCLKRNNGPMLGGEIADQFSFAWPTVTEHLQALEKAGLVAVQKQGREQIYTLRPDGLKIVQKWLDEVQG